MFKKFTNISGATVGTESKPVETSNEKLELSNFKSEVLKLMSDFLSIRSYGSARPEIMITTRIVGQEMFIEALTDLLSQKSNKEVIKTLESLKSKSNDWKSIDDKIEDIKLSVRDIKEEKKIYNVLEKYGSDEGNLKNYLETRNMSCEEARKKYELIEEIFPRTNNPMIKVMAETYLDISKK